MQLFIFLRSNPEKPNKEVMSVGERYTTMKMMRERKGEIKTLVERERELEEGPERDHGGKDITKES